MNTTMTQPSSTSVGWLAGWAVASAIGLVLGLAGTLTLVWSVTENFASGLGEQVDAILFGAVFGLGLGLVLGIAQWIVLRLRGESGPRWVGATIIGSIIGGVLAILIGNTFNPGGGNIILGALTFAILGAFIGACQFGMARSIAGSALWILASAVALGAGMSIAFQFSDMWWGAVIGGAIYGVVIAAVLWWMGRA